MEKDFLNYLSEVINDKIVSNAPILGGDIHEARKLIGKEGDYFLKLNRLPNTLRMFRAEKDGLETIKSSSEVETPIVKALGEWNKISYLVLSFVDEGFMDKSFWKSFAFDLAKLHKCTNTSFGYDKSNFIGWLGQDNHPQNSWSEFYVERRLLPQSKISMDKGLLHEDDIRDVEILCRKIDDICPKEPPALIHGDLWQGNFLASQKGNVILIDPAVYYGHREMDLAMAKLFGGFSNDFYNAYHDYFPLSPQFEKRVTIYQLYYLMVHLNLFGKSYAPAVRKIISDFVS